MNYKHTLSLLFFAVAAIAAPAHAATYTTVTVRIEAPTISTEEYVTLSSDGCTVEDESGTSYTVHGANALCALQSALSSKQLSFGMSYFSSYDSFLVNSIGSHEGSGSDFWMFYVNGQSSWVGMKDYEVQAGDEILLTYGDWPSTPLRVEFSDTQKRVGSTITATVTAYNDATGAYEPVSNAIVRIGKKVFSTGTNGTVEFSMSDRDTFTAYAEAQGYTQTAKEEIRIYKRYKKFKKMGKKGRRSVSTSAVDYLESQVAEDGMVQDSWSLTEWTAMALVSAGEGEETATIKRMKKAIRSYRPTAASGSLELARHILALEALGVDSRNVRGANYVARLQKAQEGDDGLYCNDDIFAAMAYIAADPIYTSVDLNEAILDSLECVNDDGGVGYAVGGESDVDTTAAWLMMAHQVRGKADSYANKQMNGARKAAHAYLKDAQNPDGGWGYMDTAESNSSSTAWVLLASRARGYKAHKVRTNYRHGFHFLKKTQNDASGAISYDTSDTYSNDILNTAYGVLAFEPAPLPVNRQLKLRR